MTTAPQGTALEPLGPQHLQEVFALFGDPRVWTHLPSGRHTDPAASAAVIARAEASRAATGLGSWAVRDTATRRLAGTAGVDLTAPGCWNLGYRFDPDVQGRGIASAVARLAIDAAHAARPGVPVVARILEANAASIRVAERVGLPLEWRGDAVAADGSGRARRIHADRAVSAELLEALVALG